MLNIYYQGPISVVIPFKLKIQQCQLKMTRKEEPLHSNLAESSEVKSLPFPLSFCK